MKQVWVGDYTEFTMDYMGGDYAHERFGQAFLNKFYTGTDVVDSQLFYCDDKTKAVDLIFARYITVLEPV